MGIYSEYLDKQMTFEELVKERKTQLKRISQIRNRSIIVYASDINKNSPNSIDYSDIVPFSDQLNSLKGNEIDIIIETPGGLAEVVEDLVKLVRTNFEKVGIIIPGMSKSAGTIFTMAADEILMGTISSLGPIDAQMFSNGKRFSADAFLEGLNKIREDAEKNKRLDIAYIPILQNISPGEIQHCKNAQAFSRTLVTDWLKKYKFKFWEKHSSTGLPVTDEEKNEKAKQIATLLCNHSHWLTHGRSIKIEDLVNMGLQITDYTKNDELNDAITRYYTLLKMSFETNIFKIYETPDTQIYRSINNSDTVQDNVHKRKQHVAFINVECAKCHAMNKIQINFDKNIPIEAGSIPFPKNNVLKCCACGTESNILDIRQKVEAQFGKPII